MKKKMCMLLILIFAFWLSACSKHDSEPCEWCDTTNTTCIEKEDGGKCYVCDEHSKKCIYCGKKVERHYSSPTGMEVFVCEPCYEEDMELMRAVENGEFDNLE